MSAAAQGPIAEGQPGEASVALALATYNQAALLERFLGNYLRDGADLVPLIVVDDGSNDATPELLLALAASHPRITVHRLSHVSAAHARNHALRNAPVTWLAFSDTDCILDRRYFQTLATLPARFAGSPAVEGAVLPSPGPKPPFTHSLHNRDGGTYATANMVFHVPTVLALGGFDEGFTVNFREDTDLALTILDRSGPIPFCPELIVEHPHLPRGFFRSLRNAWFSQDRLIRAEMRLFAKHPGGYRKVRFHRDARATLAAWCWKYFAGQTRDCLLYLREPGLSAAERARGIFLSAQALAVAALEQICIDAICLTRAGEIARLRAP